MKYLLTLPSPAGRMGWRKSGTKSVACRYVLIIKRNVFPELGNRHNRLVQDVFGHGVLGVGVTTKRVIDYYYQSRLPSAWQVQDMFIIVAAISVKHVRR